MRHKISRSIASTLLFALFSCTYEEKPLKEKYAEKNDDQIELIQGMASIDIIDGQQLRIQLNTTGCFVVEDEPVIIIKRKEKTYLVSYYSGGQTILSNKILDSSFVSQLKGFIHECKKHEFKKEKMPDTSFLPVIKDEFRNVEKIIISDGLHIQGITLDNSIKSNPFRYLVSAIYWHGQRKLLAD